MPLQPLFGCLRPLIEEHFASARSDAGDTIATVELRLEEEPLSKGPIRAEFMCIDPAGPVRVTWNGIASVWALCQGAARLSRRMFEARTESAARLDVNGDPELRRGIDSLDLAVRYRTANMSSPEAASVPWPDWAPPIDANPPVGSDDYIGLQFFGGALDFMLRHELAHVALKHAEREKSGTVTYRECEEEADIQAAKWLLGVLQADAERELQAPPAEPEKRLEWRGISIGIGLIWIALFEAPLVVKSDKYPPVADRLAYCLDVLGLREDSAAAEILSYVIKAWIEPEDDWPVSATAYDGLNEATFRLHRFLTN